ncbi:MAG: hypothetical protein M1822_002437 [Bathelium mastoideum]|nr:MAG: hypothetical protein M1822_002437 [Bathelium mastoideum]
MSTFGEEKNEPNADNSEKSRLPSRRQALKKKVRNSIIAPTKVRFSPLEKLLSQSAISTFNRKTEDVVGESQPTYSDADPSRINAVPTPRLDELISSATKHQANYNERVTQRQKPEERRKLRQPSGTPHNFTDIDRITPVAPEPTLGINLWAYSAKKTHESTNQKGQEHNIASNSTQPASTSPVYPFSPSSLLPTSDGLLVPKIEQSDTANSDLLVSKIEQGIIGVDLEDVRPIGNEIEIFNHESKREEGFLK